ncbi:MAG: LysM peptidoglycan-binding domain-containing protein [Solobacterium sp.]|jgi:LysM repeat protein|nr:LysM peptidoglycan-binding domain-containing protein [Solobacterium sp.]MCH4050182.1 LysM peptidoglycan-binding domain-containing protein [Solobacterium sp.]MCH4073959.1 LysM peptidoglycan-binding domain-containing protein [Solobacterium sp.]
MSKTESAIQWMENHAKDNSHGYDQRYRWGERGDYDCSSAVISAWQAAGVPVKSKGATYTGNMLSVFLACGFSDVTRTVNLATGAGLQRGDVLLNTTHHTAMYCGNGKEVEASINEKGTAVGGAPGDQTGREFLIRPYRNYPWNHVLRYRESAAASAKSVTEVAKEVIAGKWGNGSERRRRLTASGYDAATVQAKVNELLHIQGRPQAVYYTVRSGDTLSAIAQKYGTTASAIQKLNPALIRNVNRIHVGWKIRVK